MTSFKHLGPYRIGEPIGRGGMGSVFKAVHEKTNEEVAVKVIAASVSDDMRFRQRFDAEIKTLIKLKHPNIVSLIGAGEQHGQMFYSMELVRGESLQQMLRREKRLAWPFVLDLAIDVCSALKHAHNFGIFHRDLKPANLLIAENGTTKLVDFGIAKIFGTADQTAAGSILGTADFMAPEQACGGPITARTDLYSLGNVLYACFAGRPPFAGRTMTRVIESLQRETPAPLDLIAPDIPAEIIQLVHNLLEKLPDDRPPTALAVMNRMKAIRAGLQRQLQIAEATKSQPQSSPTKDAKDGQDVKDAKDVKDVKDGIENSDHPTKSHRPASAETPTVIVAEPIVQRTAMPKGEATIQGPGSRLDPRTPNTHRDDDYALTGESIKSGGSSVKSGGSVKKGTAVKGSSLKAPSIRAAKIGDSALESASVASEEQATHFSTVQERERRRGLWERDEEQSKTDDWRHTVSIVAMISALAAAVVLFLWSMQRPSADELYQSIIASQERDDKVAFRTQLDQFRRLYPNDARTAELEPYLDEVDSMRIMRRLRLVSVREGGDDYLAPYEQAFLEAMRELQRDPEKARAMLGHWLNVYDPPANVAAYDVDPELQSIARAARQELERLAVKAIPAGDARNEELVKRINWASKTLEKEDLRKMLEGMESLYGDKSWAAPALQIVRQRLQELGR